jgi:hypothetical protein
MKNESFLQNYCPSEMLHDMTHAIHDYEWLDKAFRDAIKDLQSGLQINGKFEKNTVDYWEAQRTKLNELVRSKSIEDAYKEYHVKLVEIDGNYALHCIDTGEYMPIDGESLEFVNKKKIKGFRKAKDAYFNYASLCYLMGIKRDLRFSDLWTGNTADLSKKSGMPEQTVRDLMKGRTEFSRMSVANAIKLAEAMNTTVDALYKRIYNF